MKKIIALEKELTKNKFKEYRHDSGARAWSDQNLCAVSDEWRKV